MLCSSYEQKDLLCFLCTNKLRNIRKNVFLFCENLCQFGKIFVECKSVVKAQVERLKIVKMACRFLYLQGNKVRNSHQAVADHMLP